MWKQRISMNPERVKERIAQMRTSAEEFGANDGLYGVTQSVETAFGAALRALGHDVYGYPGVDPQVLLQRAALMRQRADEASARARTYFEGLRQVEASAGPLRPMGWRVALAVATAAAVVGLALPVGGWRPAAIVALSAALAILALPLLPRALRVLLVGARDLADCAGDLLSAVAAARRCRRLERLGWSAADQRARVEEWVAMQLSQLISAYEYQKGLATAARAAN